MAEQPEADQKTHEPTEKKLRDAREKGDVAYAPEVRHAVMFGAMLIVLGGLGATAFVRIAQLLTRFWGSAGDMSLNPATAQGLISGTAAETVMALGPILAVAMGCALLGAVAQGRPTISWTRVKPKFSKLSPISGLSRLFGQRALVEFAKTLAKFAAVGTAAFMIAWPSAVGLDQLVNADPMAIGVVTWTIVMAMVKTVALLVGALALFDILYQRFSFNKRMRMSRQEVRDEIKDSEGDPHIKAKIRAIRNERARRRMMAAVPTASVVITNPTHFAVALKYEHNVSGPPVVVAKGVDAVAFKIREVATAAGVPIVENPPLARALHASVDLDHPIPTEHYVAVAQVIGFVMKLARKRSV